MEPSSRGGCGCQTCYHPRRNTKVLIDAPAVEIDPEILRAGVVLERVDVRRGDVVPLVVGPPDPSLGFLFSHASRKSLRDEADDVGGEPLVTH